jgi:enterochelin esterase-like enzyme
MPICTNCTVPELPGVPSNAENFLAFFDDVLRPWVRSKFPNVAFSRDGLYGHSFAGLFTIYTLLARPEMFDVYISASPYLIWNDEYIFSKDSPLYANPVHNSRTNPALQLSYGGLEQFPQKRRTETPEAFEERRVFLSSSKMTDLVERLHAELKGSPRLRDLELHVYPFSYHAAVGSAALCDGIDYFLDW